LRASLFCSFSLGGLRDFLGRFVFVLDMNRKQPTITISLS
jgi:hypothetical protein